MLYKKQGTFCLISCIIHQLHSALLPYRQRQFIKHTTHKKDKCSANMHLSWFCQEQLKSYLHLSAIFHAVFNSEYDALLTPVVTHQFPVLECEKINFCLKLERLAAMIQYLVRITLIVPKDNQISFKWLPNGVVFNEMYCFLNINFKQTGISLFKEKCSMYC